MVALALRMIERLDEFTRDRTVRGTALAEGLSRVGGVTVAGQRAGATPAYLRLPVLFATEALRDSTVAALNAAGVGASRSYPASIADLAEVQPTLRAYRPLPAAAMWRSASPLYQPIST